MVKRLLSILLCGALLGVGAGAVSAVTLDEVKSKGWLRCGVLADQVGFSVQNKDETWSGMAC